MAVYTWGQYNDGTSGLGAGFNWGNLPNNPRNLMPVAGYKPPGGGGTNYAALNYGKVIPYSQGARMVTGDLFWCSKLKLTKGAIEDNPGVTIDGNRTGSTVQRGTYTRSFAVCLGQNLAPGGAVSPSHVRRVWMDGQLVYALGEGMPYTYDNVAETPTEAESLAHLYGALLPIRYVKQNFSFRFYAGTEDQAPDSSMVADGGDLTPAYRGLMYMVFDDFAAGTTLSQVSYGNEFFDYVSGTADDEISSPTPIKFPVVTVELVDGELATAVYQDMEYLEGLPTNDFLPTSTLLSNFNARMLTTVSQTRVHSYDMDAKSEIQNDAFTGAVGFGNGNVAVWDYFNDVIYSFVDSPTGDDRTFAIGALHRASATVVGHAYWVHYDLGPEDATGADPRTSGKPVTVLPRARSLALSYYNNGSTHAVIFGGTNFGYVIVPSNDDGSAFAPMTRDQLWTPISDPSSEMTAVAAFPLVDIGIKKGVAGYQDSAFIAVLGARVYIVYISVRGTTAKILGHELLYTCLTGSCVAFLTDTFDVMIVAGGSVLTKLSTTVDSTPSYANAPGWRGLFPHVSKTPVIKELGISWLTARSVDLNNADKKGGIQISDKRLSFGDGSVVTYPGMDTVANTTGQVFDGPNDVLYFNSFAQSQTRYVDVGTPTSGPLSELRTYLRFIALRAGYKDSDLSIDPRLTDLVVGAYLDKTIDTNKLFSDLAAVYNFSYFNSGRKLRFVRTARGSEKAAALFSLAALPVDGATVTLGARTYTFRETPAVADDVSTGTSIEMAIINLVAAVNGNAVAIQAFPTTKHPRVTGKVVDAAHAKFTSIQGGEIGNGLASASSISGAFTGASFVGGVEPPEVDVVVTRDTMTPIGEGDTGDNEVLTTAFAVPVLSNGASKINFYSLENNYALASQVYAPDTGPDADSYSLTATAYDIPFIMSATEAYNKVVNMSLRESGNTVNQTFRLPPRFLALEAGDIVEIQIPPFAYTVRLDEATYNGDYSISCSGFNYSFRDDVEVIGQTPLNVVPQRNPGDGTSTPVVLDIPYLERSFANDDAGIMLLDGVRSNGQARFSAAILTMAPPAPAPSSQVFTAATDIPWGTVRGILADTDTPFATDNTTVLKIVSKSLSARVASATYGQFIGGGNVLAIGAPGRWELVYFRDVAVTGNVVTITGLLRGRRGTDVFTGAHASGDRALLLRSVSAAFTDPLFIQLLDVEEVGESYQFISTGVPDGPSISTNVTLEGQSLTPWAVANVAAVYAGADVAFSWDRRDRLGAAFITTPLELSEDTEAYDLEIMDGAAVKRAVAALPSSGYTYTSANMATDWGGPVSEVTVRIYQIGALGRGFLKEVTLNVE